MNHKQKTKIEFFFGGFEEKYKNGKDYFIGIDVKVSSGRKNYEGTVFEKDKKFVFAFAGNREFSNFDDLKNAVTDTVIEYDSAEISYKERGITTTIIADDRQVKLSKTENDEEVSANLSQLKDKTYNISLHKAKDLLFALGYTTADGKLRNDKIRKYNQTDRFIELVKPLFSDEKDITIVDCACGKSYLSFVLNYWLWQEKRIRAKFIGLDISENVINESKKTAEKLGYTNMEFIQTDLSKLETSGLDKNVHPNTVISLHACDVATDMALGFAIRNDVENIICVPCCHKELLSQIKNENVDTLLSDRGVMRARFNAILTDSLRMLKLEACGYDVSCVEYCSPLDTPKNLLIKAKKVSERNVKKEKEFYDTIRAFSVFPSIDIYSRKD